MTNLVPFPLERRAALVRQTVRSLHLKKAEAASRHWRLTVNRAVAELQCSGILDKDVIDEEIRHFTDEVFGLLAVVDSQPGSDLGGDAA